MTKYNFQNGSDKMFNYYNSGYSMSMYKGRIHMTRQNTQVFNFGPKQCPSIFSPNFKQWPQGGWQIHYSEINITTIIHHAILKYLKLSLVSHSIIPNTNNDEDIENFTFGNIVFIVNITIATGCNNTKIESWILLLMFRNF